ncbi:MAG: (d)CMP kinase, partial [Ureaplasma sp.]|nr:(d)CMP kinase [Ureaplasma sp.]
ILNLNKIQLDFDSNNEIIIRSLNNLNPKEFIYNEEIAKIASEMAIYPDVRNKINDILKKISINKNIIMDGRDIGTVVLPNADLKIFIDANSKTRALRRLKDENLDISCLEKIQKIIEQRDNNDYNRPIGALRIADDAIVIKNDDLTIDDCCKLIISHLKTI